ncbi:MAG: hypothetical protein ABI488_16685 [Polyangiaceae bacterium]
MKIRRIASGLWVMGALLSACATQRSAEPAAPASAEDRAAPSSVPAAEPASPVEATPAPAIVPAPQGLDKPKSAEAARDDEFPNLEAAERALNQAKSDLDRLALAAPMPVVGRASSADGASADKAEKKDAKRASPSAAGTAAASTAPSLCDNACRAFASLSRAASAVCRLDGDNGAHCTHAKHVLSDSQLRVASCACQAGD